MTAATPSPDPAVGGTPPTTDTTAAATDQQNLNPATGQPYPPMGVPTDPNAEYPEDVVSNNPDDIAGNNVYMSIAWMNISKETAQQIRDAALAASPLTSYSVTFSSPMTDDS